MYVEGDIVKGNCIIDNEFGIIKMIPCSKYKEDLIKINYPSYPSYLIDTEIYLKEVGKNAYDNLLHNRIKSVHPESIFGIVTGITLLEEDRPHINGLVSVLVKDKLLWFFAGDLKIVKFSTTIENLKESNKIS